MQPWPNRPGIVAGEIQVAKYAKKSGIKNLFLLTNGILINKENINKLKIFDGIQLSLDNIPTRWPLRKNYSNVLEKTVLLLQSKKIKINFYCTLCKNNYGEIDQIINYAKKLKVRIGFNTLIPFDANLEGQILSPLQTKKAFKKRVNRHFVEVFGLVWSEENGM